MAQSARTRIEEITTATAESVLARGRELLLEYGGFVIAQPGAGRFCFGSLREEAERLPSSFTEQGGGCLMAWAHDEPAGFIAWRALPASSVVPPGSWEMKRLWVRPASRGLGLGRSLTEAVLRRAAVAGCRAVLLDTAPASMGAAHRMYLDLGFTPCAPYNDNPVEGLVYLVKNL